VEDEEKMPIDYVSMRQALRAFAGASVTQSQEHIKPLHQHIAFRLVCEGGFLPDELTPHPPLRAERRKGSWRLEYAPDAQTKGELTVFGGMKTKQIDVVVDRTGIGPVLAVSVKGTLGAYRNLTNRMEEAIGDSTNVHVMYPGLVYGFLHLVRANRESSGYDRRDYGIGVDNSVSSLIERYVAALHEMAGRRFVRDDPSGYESVGLALVENDPDVAGHINGDYPTDDSPLRVERFFARLYETYDLRFPLRADNLAAARRIAWAPESPLFDRLTQQHDADVEDVLGFAPRLG